MTKTTLIATAVAAIAGAGTAAGAGALAAPATKTDCPGKEVRAVRQDVRKAVQQARQTAFTGADRVAAAKPVLDKAVAAKTIDQAMADKVLARLKEGRQGQQRHGRRRP